MAKKQVKKISYDELMERYNAVVGQLQYLDERVKSNEKNIAVDKNIAVEIGNVLSFSKKEFAVIKDVISVSGRNLLSLSDSISETWIRIDSYNSKPWYKRMFAKI